MRLLLSIGRWNCQRGEHAVLRCFCSSTKDSHRMPYTRQAEDDTERSFPCTHSHLRLIPRIFTPTFAFLPFSTLDNDYRVHKSNFKLKPTKPNLNIEKICTPKLIFTKFLKIQETNRKRKLIRRILKQQYIFLNRKQT